MVTDLKQEIENRVRLTSHTLYSLCLNPWLQLSEVDSTGITCFQAFPVGGITVLLDIQNIKIHSKTYNDYWYLQFLSFIYYRWDFF